MIRFFNFFFSFFICFYLSLSFSEQTRATLCDTVKRIDQPRTTPPRANHSKQTVESKRQKGKKKDDDEKKKIFSFSFSFPFSLTHTGKTTTNNLNNNKEQGTNANANAEKTIIFSNRSRFVSVELGDGLCL